MEKIKSTKLIDDAISALEKYYEYGNQNGFSKTELSRIRSSLNKVRKVKANNETSNNEILIDVNKCEGNSTEATLLAFTKFIKRCDKLI